MRQNTMNVTSTLSARPLITIWLRVL
jgi:hypothetical protein